MSAPLPPGARVTAYCYALNRGLPVNFGYLLELGLRAARLARWYRIGEAKVPEGPLPDGTYLKCHTWPAQIWAEAAASFPPVPPEPWLTAWQYAGRAKMLTSEGDPAFAADLDHYANPVGRRRGLVPVLVTDDRGLYATWPESLWRDVSGAMAQRGAESGETELDECDLDAVADGYFPDPEYRPGGLPSVAQFMARGSGDSDGTAPGHGYWEAGDYGETRDAGWGPWFDAGYDDDCDGCGAIISEGDRIRADGEGGWLCADCGEDVPRTRAVPPRNRARPAGEADAGWGPGPAPWDSEDM